MIFWSRVPSSSSFESVLLAAAAAFLKCTLLFRSLVTMSGRKREELMPLSVCRRSKVSAGSWVCVMHCSFSPLLVHVDIGRKVQSIDVAAAVWKNAIAHDTVTLALFSAWCTFLPLSLPSTSILHSQSVWVVCLFMCCVCVSRSRGAVGLLDTNVCWGEKFGDQGQ